MKIKEIISGLEKAIESYQYNYRSSFTSLKTIMEFPRLLPS